MPPQMKILNMVIPILMHYQHFLFKKTMKMYFVALIRPAAASCIKPLASCIYSLVNQWKATLRNDVGFPTVYRRIYCRKIMTLSNQTSRCICKCISIKDSIQHSLTQLDDRKTKKDAKTSIQHKNPYTTGATTNQQQQNIRQQPRPQFSEISCKIMMAKINILKCGENRIFRQVS